MFRVNNINRFDENILPQDIFLTICDFLKLHELFCFSATDKLVSSLCLSSLITRVNQNTYLKWKAGNTLANDLKETKPDSPQANILLERTKLHIRLGLTDFLVGNISVSGHLQILKMLYQTKFIDMQTSATEVSNRAVEHNHPAIIDYLLEANIKLNPHELFEKASRNWSLATIKLLLNTDSDFYKFTSGDLNIFCYTLNFTFGESEAWLKARVNIFELLLEFGYFPKEGKKFILDWLDNHFESVQPLVINPFEYYFPSDEIMNHREPWRNYNSDNIQRIPEFEIQYNILRIRVKHLLNKFERSYLAKTKFMLFQQNKNKITDERNIELQSLRRV